MAVMAHRVLLVDNDERIRASVRLCLEDEGYVVAEASTGEEALELHAFALGGDPFDLLVLDIRLPDMDGFKCCRALRRTSAVPILIATACTDTKDVITGLDAGADDYVVKPFEARELSARIRALLSRGQGRFA
jgi:DNA-binding response OmpR family regulator